MKIKEIIEELNKAKAGEGSRGGKIIGHTKSGQPVYEHSEGHFGINVEKNEDAANVHKQHANKLKSRIESLRVGSRNTSKGRVSNDKKIEGLGKQIEHHEKMAKYHQKIVKFGA